MALMITNYFSRSSSGTPKPPDSDNIVLAPSSINPNHDSNALIEPEEFKLQGKQYIRCSSLAKPPKHTKKRTSIIWLYGEDIQLKQDATKKFWYCYFCEKQHCQQELPVAGKGNSTALDHLEWKHNFDRKTGQLRPSKEKNGDPNQLSISDYNDMKSIIFSCQLNIFKDLLVRWIVCCHITLFQIKNVFFHDLLFYLFSGLQKVLLKAAATLCQWVKLAFKTKKEGLWQDMQEAYSNISIFFDL